MIRYRRRSYRVPRQYPVRGSLGGPVPGASGKQVPASVMCCIDDVSAASMPALQFAARLASRRDRGRADLEVILVRTLPYLFIADPVPYFEWLGSGAGVEAKINQVAAQFGLTVRIHEVAGWSRTEIVAIARERGSAVVIVPMLDDEAGPVTRWVRRDLVAALVERTQAVVVDEYDRSFAGQP